MNGYALDQFKQIGVKVYACSLFNNEFKSLYLYGSEWRSI
ncbi:hypothetical protein THF1D04_40182 [Vibrio owensii]|uniref:Uncharacterized protein n=1 Tax=Vibrio owensii TaxID=696485 RepID=A0AAU9Q9K7_9VIBR|nr:hypothetical protein THF1D04_40182 [Vibrio owensii]